MVGACMNWDSCTAVTKNARSSQQFPFLGRLRHQAVNSALPSRYLLPGRRLRWDLVVSAVTSTWHEPHLAPRKPKRRSNYFWLQDNFKKNLPNFQGWNWDWKKEKEKENFANNQIYIYIYIYIYKILKDF